ncbi:MAG: YcxB family protein [Lachnospiraceae bacterium]|nr:YcxB family protein [Lachnospiraceae bacterium]
MEPIRFSVKMKTLYLFDFLYVNSYSGFRAVINYTFSGIAIVALIFGYGSTPISLIALILLASLFTVIEPLMLLFKAFRQVKLNPAFKNEINYCFEEEKFTVSQGEQSQEAPWEMVLLAKESFKSIILFTGNNNAIILPKDCIGDKLNDFKLLLKKVRPNESEKLRTV